MYCTTFLDTFFFHKQFMCIIVFQKRKNNEKKNMINMDQIHTYITSKCLQRYQNLTESLSVRYKGGEIKVTNSKKINLYIKIYVTPVRRVDINRDMSFIEIKIIFCRSYFNKNIALKSIIVYKFIIVSFCCFSFFLLAME